MSGLTLNTEAAVPTAATAPRSTAAPEPDGQAQQPQTLSQQPQAPQPSCSSSPVRPPYSPITPPLRPKDLLPPRPEYSHSSHVDATAANALPRLELIDFESNPDVLAVKSAISILQLQRRKAEADVATLDKVRKAALAEPDAFVRDLVRGRVRVEREGLFVGGVRTHGQDESSTDSDEEKDEKDGAVEKTGLEHAGGPAVKREVEDEQTQMSSGAVYGDRKTSIVGANASEPTTSFSSRPTVNSSNQSPRLMDIDLASGTKKPWAAVPKPQNIVRCPPINWSQYAVVGESLDKLHGEQIARPTQGTPALVTSDGRFEFQAGESALGKQEKLVGVAAPYTPGRDRLLDKKPKGTKR